MSAAKLAYGIPVPRGVRKDWEVTSMTLDSAGAFMRRHSVPVGWGDPDNCVAWFDRFGHCRVCVGHFSNGRAVTVRRDANGSWKASYGDASGTPTRSAETGTGSVAEGDGGPVRASADAQTPPEAS